MICGALSKHDALMAWDFVEPLIRRATDRDRGRTDPEFLKSLIEDGKAVLWVKEGLDLACITTIERYPTGKLACTIRACGGEGLEVCQKEIEMIASYAKDMGCELLEICGREGWLRALKGFEKDYVTITRNLNEQHT